LKEILTTEQLLPGIISFVVSVLLVLSKKWHGKHSMDTTDGVQKFHVHPTPRIGGVALFLGLIAAWWLASGSTAQLFGQMLIASLPAFAAGLTEDLTKKVSVRVRLLATMLSAVVAWWLTGYTLTRVDIWGGVDLLLTYAPVAVLFTAFAVAGVANATNIIDGFNGLASGTVMICFTALGVIAWQVGDEQIVHLCVLMVVVTGGFFVVNFPFGKIFMGDGGAYLLGFMLAWVAVMLPMRNSTVSVWAPLLVCGYPVIETVFSMGRRFSNNNKAGHPDSAHLHSLIKVRIVNRYFIQFSQHIRNSLVSPFCWLYSSILAPLAIIFHGEQAAILGSLVCSIVLYAAIYWFLINSKRVKESQHE
jgi:UDP-N-acetylmuramyl pentapeptide phosphotransferase/UDP-N-acetylglucosamine-1-phosphate transferase